MPASNTAVAITCFLISALASDDGRRYCPMRLRIQTFGPLPELKAWFVPEIKTAQETVFDLKGLLCKGVQPLRNGRFQAKDLILILEEFELLNDSPLTAVRDGDLIFVKVSPLATNEDQMDTEPVRNSKKRKRVTSKVGRKVLTQRISTARGETSNSEEESTSDSESTTSSTSVSSSSSDSSSSSSSNSSSSSAAHSPPKNVIKLTERQRLLIAKQISASQKPNAIPPGHGKPSTHSRNRRRKKKRDYQKIAKTGPLESLTEVSTAPRSFSEATSAPVGSSRLLDPVEPVWIPLSTSPLARSSKPTAPQTVVPLSNKPTGGPLSIQDYVSTQREAQDTTAASNTNYVYITPDQVVMGSLRNKNKKKGFKHSMAGPIPRKIVFTDDERQRESNNIASAASKPSEDVALEMNVTDLQSPSTRKPFSRLIPPSELQELGQLPPNMFVTCVDVGVGIMDFGGSSSRKQGRKRKGKGRDMYEYDWGQGQADGYEEVFYDNERMLLHDTTARNDTTLSKPSGEDAIDWSKAEQRWETSVVVQSPEQIAIGALVGWKALAINPETFTPEILLFLARVLGVEGEGAERKVNIRPLHRLQASGAALAFGISMDGEGDEDIAEVENIAWSDVLGAQWRLIQL